MFVNIVPEKYGYLAKGKFHKSQNFTVLISSIVQEFCSNVRQLARLLLFSQADPEIFYIWANVCAHALSCLYFLDNSKFIFPEILVISFVSQFIQFSILDDIL
jgi:hypothetical protein